MTERVPTVINKQVYMRLIALWVACEAFAGGILHTFKLPFTGLGVSSLAVICIILISYHVPVKGTILKATIIVAIFKLMLSPQAAPTAYFALFFQGLMGTILLRRRYFSAGAIVFGMLALMETAIQRILILSFIYGNSFWVAVDEFMKKVITKGNINSFSITLAVSYICIHVIAGFFIGLYGAKLARKATVWQKNELLIFPLIKEEILENQRKKRKYLIIIIIWLVLLLLYVQQFLPGGLFVLEATGAARIFFRSIIIICTWIAIISPLIRHFIAKRLIRLKNRYETEIREVLLLLPNTLFIIRESWKRARKEKAKLKSFLKYVLTNIL